MSTTYYTDMIEPLQDQIRLLHRNERARDAYTKMLEDNNADLRRQVSQLSARLRDLEKPFEYMGK
jgi:hypothetical protein